MTTKEPKEEGKAEKRFQSIMLTLCTALLLWSFNSTIQMGKDIAAIQVQLLNLTAEKASQQTTVNQHGLDINSLRADENNSMRRLSDLEIRKH